MANTNRLYRSKIVQIVVILFIWHFLKDYQMSVFGVEQCLDQTFHIIYELLQNV